MTGTNKPRYFEKRYNFRFSEEIMKEASFLVRVCLDENNEPRFDNLSHFVRVAIIRLTKEEKDRIRKQDEPKKEKKNGKKRRR